MSDPFLVFGLVFIATGFGFFIMAVISERRLKKKFKERLRSTSAILDQIRTRQRKRGYAPRSTSSYEFDKHFGTASEHLDQSFDRLEATIDKHLGKGFQILKAESSGDVNIQVGDTKPRKKRPKFRDNVTLETPSFLKRKPKPTSKLEGNPLLDD